MRALVTARVARAPRNLFCRAAVAALAAGACSLLAGGARAQSATFSLDRLQDHLPPNPDDGCPTSGDDDDGDGIPNAVDACPNAPGLASSDPKKNGCPIYITPPPKGGEQIVLLKPIEFETAKSTILARSFPILDEVVKFLAVNPSVKHLAIEGHTDDRGPEPLNEKLSDDRAHSVMSYLVEHGVAAERLSAKGFGPHRPIDDNRTAGGRQRNRRVEFHLVE